MIMEAENKIMMVFVAFAVVIGAICGFLELSGEYGGLLALVFFYISYRVSVAVPNPEEEEVDTGAWNIIKTGAIPYWFLLLVVWTLIHTLTFY